MEIWELACVILGIFFSFAAGWSVGLVSGYPPPVQKDSSKYFAAGLAQTNNWRLK